MLTESDVLKTLKILIQKANICSIGFTIKGIATPSYRCCSAICQIGVKNCSSFYSEIGEKNIFTGICPFGFKVVKRTISSDTKYREISIYGITNHQEIDIHEIISCLPRKLKKLVQKSVAEFDSMTFNEEKCNEEISFVYNVIETLLVGRKGIAIQGISHQFFTPLQGAMADVQNIRNNENISESSERLS